MWTPGGKRGRVLAPLGVQTEVQHQSFQLHAWMGSVNHLDNEWESLMLSIIQGEIFFFFLPVLVLCRQCGSGFTGHCLPSVITVVVWEGVAKISYYLLSSTWGALRNGSAEGKFTYLIIHRFKAHNSGILNVFTELYNLSREHPHHPIQCFS